MDIQKKEIIKKMFKSIYGVGYIILFLVGLAFILSATINIYLDKKACNPPFTYYILSIY